MNQSKKYNVHGSTAAINSQRSLNFLLSPPHKVPICIIPHMVANEKPARWLTHLL